GEVDRIESGAVVEVEQPRNPRKSGIAPGHHLQLLREGRLGSLQLDIDERQRSAVLIEVIVIASVAIGRDAHEAQGVEVLSHLQTRAVLPDIASGVEVFSGIVVARGRTGTPE